MKKLSMMMFTVMVFFSCNNGGTVTSEAAKDSTAVAPATAVKMDYPYTIDHPDNWEIGSSANTVVAVSALKAYENGNIDACVKNFGDSIHLQFDELDTKVANDSLKSMFTKSRGALKALNIKMYDWESVISRDKKDEYVTLWYKESWEDSKGKSDSVSVVDDLKIKEGKIVELSETRRKYPGKKM